MQPNQNERNALGKLHVGEVFTDEATKIKIHKHLNDINDTISEDDIRNVRTTIFSPNVSYGKKPVTGKDRDKNDGNNTAEINTTWNILS